MDGVHGPGGQIAIAYAAEKDVWASLFTKQSFPAGAETRGVGIIMHPMERRSY